MKKRRNIILTTSITLLITLFIATLLYIIYCYGYYDNSIKTEYLNKYNEQKYDYIYEKLEKEDKTLDEYNIVINLMFNKTKLENIYNKYYSNNYNLEEFFNKYYFGNKIELNNIEYKKEGKTNLINRSNITINKINIKNENQTTTLGLLKNITISKEDNSKLTIDRIEIECNNECIIDKIYGGRHEITYDSNGNEYYGLININKDNQIIDITQQELIITKQTEIKQTFTLTPGTYKVSECYLPSSCPNKGLTYIKLNENQTVDYYMYITYEQAGDVATGTYTIDGNFLTLNFDYHVYQVFDYDTQTRTDIPAETNIKYEYIIKDNNYFWSEKYSFYYIG